MVCVPDAFMFGQATLYNHVSTPGKLSQVPAAEVDF